MGTVVPFEPRETPPSPDGRVPPHDLDSEAAVIASVLLDPTRLGQLQGFLKAEHFYSEAHRRIFEACLDLGQAGSPVDIVTVGSWLKARDRINQVGGLPYLTEILNAVPVLAHVVEYGAIVHEKWRARRTIAICQETAARGYVDYGETQTYVDGVVRALAMLANNGIGAPVESNVDAIRRLLKSLLAQADSPVRDRVHGLPTGLRAYDALTFGLHSGHKTTIVATSGVGKTTAALQIARNVAAAGFGVLMFSTEQPRDELLLKLLSAQGRVDHDRLRAGRMSDSEVSRLHEAAEVCKDLPLWIEERKELNIEQLRQIALAHAERLLLVTKRPLGLIVLDYVQNLVPIPAMASAQKHEQIAHSTKGFKNLCRELKIPGIELAQRKPLEYEKGSKVAVRPVSGCISDSQQIEKDADNLVVLHRNPAYGPSGKVIGEDRSSVSWCLLKQRGGRAGEFRTKFMGEFSTFETSEEPEGEPQDDFASHYGDRP